ncbi:FAD-dependent monooxygenase [Sphingomonas gilva]|uniref:FAD-dependent monooxygenase n=1 Tax=Sphingomonas gilva TaxID=2305907 RepID=A0A396RKF9_9SPHN|nr:NAD(P)/FAD-dependent oxidoreductase [Sphingomonas gilva]RHW16728.1 FAD-dependent monooxygenase [Sphingomonas gilva]
MRPLEIAVAGCGPAGLAAALLLHRAGHRVTLYDRFEAPEPIGSGLMIQPTGQAVLAALGLEDELIARGARIDRLVGWAGKRTVLDVRYDCLRGKRFGIGIHRATLFALMHDAARAAGIRFVTGHEITGCEPRGDGRVLTFADRAVTRPYQLVVDALGARSRLRGETGRALAYGALWASLDWPDAGFDTAALQQRYRAARVMAGVLPIGTPPGFERPQAAFFWSLRADRLEAWRAAGLARWKAEVLALWPETAPLIDQIADPDQLTFARYAHRTLAAPCELAMIHIGDAWHATSPQLGQGANMALLDAWALARALDGASADLARALNRAVALRRRHVRLYQALSLLLTPVYQSDGRLVPWLRDWLVGPLSRTWPVPQIQAAMVSGLVANPLRRLGL